MVVIVGKARYIFLFRFCLSYELSGLQRAISLGEIYECTSNVVYAYASNHEKVGHSKITFFRLEV